MEYDPLKNKLAKAIQMFPALRILVYKAMDMILLRQRYVKREMLAHFREKERFSFYDAGAGFCQYTWFVLKHWPNSQVLATDLKSDYLKSFSFYASGFASGRFSYKSADLQRYVPPQQYQLAIAIDILEHIEDDNTALRKLYQTLAPEGMLIISTPSDTDEAAKFTAEHVRPGYAKIDLETKLHKAGFELVKSIYTYGFWGSLAWRLLMKYPLQITSKKLYPLLVPYYIVVYPFAELFMRMDMLRNNPSGTGILIVAQKPRA
ncbi:MAG: class I SAM-dependent methyltransferase [Candidatus Cloacimonetes bacterium]|nr:class I SAM-dependent methyltransferase [Candidatus Cloacimonadota bacterium]MDD3236373.1 class I SAM-dependent methyltransferase [Candidatus Cloacimonadota bacterium]